METWQIGILVAVCFVLMFKRGFWFIAFTMGSLAAGVESFATIAIFHIASTLGYGILMLAFWFFAIAIAGCDPLSRDKAMQVGAALGIPLADLHIQLAELKAKNQIMLCDSIRYVKGKEIKATICRISGYMPPAKPGAKSKKVLTL